VADWPLVGDGQLYQAGSITSASSQGQAVTAGGSAHTKGSYANLLTAANNLQDSQGFFIWAINSITTPGVDDCLLDIAFGAAGSEQIVVPDLLVSVAATTPFTCFYFPIAVPSGTRIAGRSQSTTASRAMRVSCHTVSTGLTPSSPLQRVTAYGTTSTSATKGTSIDAGGTANTKGSWTEIVSAANMTNPMSFMLVVIGDQSTTHAGAGSVGFLLDIGIGASGSETVLAANLPIRVSAQQDPTSSSWYGSVSPLAFPLFPAALPAGTRLAARMQANTTDAALRKLDVALYGID
jgi:hypothetical protein